MSEQQTKDSDGASKQPPEPQSSDNEAPAFLNLKSGIAWGESITKKRALELEDNLQRWEHEDEHYGNRGPFDLERLSGADVFWLVARVLTGEFDMESLADSVKLIRPDSHSMDDEIEALHLEGAFLQGAHLEGAVLRKVHLENAHLIGAHLEGASLDGAYLESAFCSRAHMEGACCDDAHFKNISLDRAHLEGATLVDADLEDALLSEAHLEGAALDRAHLENAVLDYAHLEGASFMGAFLERASMMGASLNGKRVPPQYAAHIRRWARQSHIRPDYSAYLDEADMADASKMSDFFREFPDVLPPADFSLAFLDSGTALDGITLGNDTFGYIAVADVRWRDVNLAVLDWTRTTRGLLGLRKRVEAIELGDEREAHQANYSNGKPKDKGIRLAEYKGAVRANRQLATALRSQGLNEDADRFAYKAQTLQREVLRRQGNVGGYAFSFLLWLLSGYGYRLWRIAAAYGLALVTFAVIFLALGMHSHAGEPGIQALWDSFLISLSAIHGRTMFEQLGSWTPAAWVAAVESVVGIVIEGVFVAMLIQRFFAR